MEVKNTYSTNDELIADLRKSVELGETENKKIIKSYENMCAMYAIMGGLCVMLCISILNQGYGMAIISGLLKLIIKVAVIII